MILWPCVATFQNGAIRSNVKVWSTPDRCDVYAWNVETRRVELLAHSDHPARSIDSRVHEVDVDDGTMVRVAVGDNCGCGHPLRYFNPARSSVTPG